MLYIFSGFRTIAVQKRPLMVRDLALWYLLPASLWERPVRKALFPYAVRGTPSVKLETVAGYTCKGKLERKQTN